MAFEKFGRFGTFEELDSLDPFLRALIYVLHEVPFPRWRLEISSTYGPLRSTFVMKNACASFQPGALHPRAPQVKMPVLYDLNNYFIRISCHRVAVLCTYR